MDVDQEELEAADKRVETAKASLLRHLHELERRVNVARERLDIGSKIAAHPRAAVGIAFGAGVVLGLLRSTASARTVASANGERSMGSAIIAALGALAVQGLKELVLSEGADLAKGWWGDRSERDASRDPKSVEPFLEH
jgi:hypothetical protein